MGNKNSVKEEQHNCNLPQVEDILVRYIYTGKCVPLRRKLRDWTLIDEKNPSSIVLFRSLTAISYEKLRHLHYFYYTIHPFSIFRKLWENFILVSLTFSLVFLPIQATYINDLTSWWETMKLVTDLIFICDITMNFLTGYFDQKTRIVVLKKTAIAIHYMGNFFVFDVVSSLNVNFFAFSTLSDELLMLLKVCNFFKVVRLITLVRYMDKFRENYKINPYMFKIFKLAYIGIVSCMWSACIMFFIAFYNEEVFLKDGDVSIYGWEGFVICSKRVVRLVLLVGNYEAAIHSAYEMIFEIFLVYLGALTNLYIFALILQIVNKYNACGNKYYMLTQSLQEYASCMKLPAHLKHKIINYFDFKFQKVYYKENEIIGTLSKHLQHGIVMHICKNLLESVEIFQNLPPTLLINIVTNMKSVVFLPTDVIVQAGTEGESMFFIHIGTVAIYTNLGKEVCHLGEGSHFGEIALIMEERRVASVIAVDSCELFSLTRKDFHKAIEPYPDLYTRIKTLAQIRLAKTLKQIDEDSQPKDAHYVPKQ